MNDKKRAREYIAKATNEEVGGGKDPVGFLIASHSSLTKQNRLLEKALEDMLKQVIVLKDTLDKGDGKG